eukprot:scaffold28292_cov71-Cyclotella_meneghiniana.AAC.2
MPNAGLDDNALGDSAVRIMTLLSMGTYQTPDSLTCSASTRGFNRYKKRESNIRAVSDDQKDRTPIKYPYLAIVSMPNTCFHSCAIW